MKFHDREEAGKKLAQALSNYRGKEVVIYALPRGGVVLGAEIAKYLEAPLDLVIPRKVGHPLSPEYAIAAITEDGQIEINQSEAASIDQGWFKGEVKKEITEAKRRRREYLKNRQPLSVQGKTAIIVDDGIATGLTMLAAIKDLKQKHPKQIVVAIPVTPKDSADILRQQADELIALDEPRFYMGAVGAYYSEFDQVEDKEVIKIMDGFTSK